MRDGELHFLNDVFGGGERRLTIPEYQRSYSWEEAQRSDLLADIERATQSDYVHFTGTIVATPRGGTYELIDGQQRLTTLIILLNELLKHDDARAAASSSDVDIARAIFGRDGSDAERRFRLNHMTDDFFSTDILRDPMQPGELRTKAHENLHHAKAMLGRWARDCPRRPAALETIVKRLGFLFYVPRESQEAGLMFEVINNRGKPLSQLEKVKNYLVYVASRQAAGPLDDAIRKRWGLMLENLHRAGLDSNADEDAFLRSAWIVFGDHRKSESWQVQESLRERFPETSSDSPARLAGLVEFLFTASGTMRRLLDPTAHRGEADEALTALSLHGTGASVLPLIIAVHSVAMSEADRKMLLELIERLNFRFYVCPIARRADTGQGDLFWWARHVYSAWETTRDGEFIDARWLEGRLKGFIRDRAGDRAFVQALTLDKDEDYDFHWWQGLPFFLASYEAHLIARGEKTPDVRAMLRTGKRLNDRYEREHLWARGDEVLPESERHFHIRRLGNFALLEPSINRSVKASSIGRKLELYWSATDTHHQTASLKELRELFQEKHQAAAASGLSEGDDDYWRRVYLGFIDEREKRLVSFALERWSVDHGGPRVTRVEIDSSREREVFVPQEE